ncbi:prepilin-type N-terminal cleavage/methylation domain-containing protein [Patescibacteria group bacterium]|nr:prepilin-type N-terminal cleavage/methylation domain-containing protein [Patescibacteria group bacterium]MCL5114806.1 prepilin-type N-terminal cleavage/methylation domain-containing protein [Patescibacteria group bacterium]
MRRGFTLIELLIVVALLSVLATAVILIINPAELLAQGRDALRISDLATLNSTLALFQADHWQRSIGAV